MRRRPSCAGTVKPATTRCLSTPHTAWAKRMLVGSVCVRALRVCARASLLACLVSRAPRCSWRALRRAHLAVARRARRKNVANSRSVQRARQPQRRGNRAPPPPPPDHICTYIASKHAHCLRNTQTRSSYRTQKFFQSLNPYTSDDSRAPVEPVIRRHLHTAGGWVVEHPQWWNTRSFCAFPPDPTRLYHMILPLDVLDPSGPFLQQCLGWCGGPCARNCAYPALV